MAAQAHGLTTWQYVTRRTYRDLLLDVQALAKRWSWPAEVLLSAFGGGGNSRMPAPTAADGDSATVPTGEAGDFGTMPNGEVAIPSWFKRKRGWDYRAFDLGPIQDEEKTPLGKRSGLRKQSRQDYAIAASALKASFKGSRGGVSGAPLPIPKAG